MKRSRTTFGASLLALLFCAAASLSVQGSARAAIPVSGSAGAGTCGSTPAPFDAALLADRQLDRSTTRSAFPLLACLADAREDRPQILEGSLAQVDHRIDLAGRPSVNFGRAPPSRPLN